MYPYVSVCYSYVSVLLFVVLVWCLNHDPSEVKRAREDGWHFRPKNNLARTNESTEPLSCVGGWQNFQNCCLHYVLLFDRRHWQVPIVPDLLQWQSDFTIDQLCSMLAYVADLTGPFRRLARCRCHLLLKIAALKSWLLGSFIRQHTAIRLFN